MFNKELPNVMKDIGFTKKGSRHYIHPECDHLFIEFPSSFLEIGEDNEIEPEEVEHDGVKIKILSPTDCVKDRLASYIHWNARECLDQAVLVARRHAVNLKAVEKWCVEEKGESQWIEFLQVIKSSN